MIHSNRKKVPSRNRLTERIPALPALFRVVKTSKRDRLTSDKVPSGYQKLRQETRSDKRSSREEESAIPSSRRSLGTRTGRQEFHRPVCVWQYHRLCASHIDNVLLHARPFCSCHRLAAVDNPNSRKLYVLLVTTTNKFRW